MEYIQGLAGVPATKSKISDIDGEKGVLYYRGYSIEELAKSSTFEEVCLLLLNGDLPTREELKNFRDDLIDHRGIESNISSIMQHLPRHSSSMQVLQVGISLLSSFFPTLSIREDGNYSPEQQYEFTSIILSHIATLVAMWDRLQQGYALNTSNTDGGYAENFLFMIHGKEADEFTINLLEKCLILHAEHTINASTFTAMVTASTLANPCAVIVAAIASLSGPLHGGANRAVVSMIEEINGPKNVEKYIDKRLKNNEIIWGLGHREYKVKDPRAKILEKMLTEWLGKEKGGSKLLETAKKVEEVCEDRLGAKRIYPNVDFYSGILYKQMGLRPDLYTPLFAVSRTAGWLAHFIEQLNDNKIFRPTQIYVGSEPRKYVPIERRT